MSDTLPADLLPVDDAARLVGRSKSTVRAWVRAGEVEGFREDPTRPENSRLLVSAAAVRQRAEESPVPRDGAPTREATVASPVPSAGGTPAAREGDAEAATLRAEVERLRAGMVAALEGRVAALEGRIVDLNRAIELERLRGEEWRARALGAEAEREALRVEKGLPWWRRLLGGGPALPAPPEGD